MEKILGAINWGNKRLMLGHTVFNEKPFFKVAKQFTTDGDSWVHTKQTILVPDNKKAELVAFLRDTADKLEEEDG